MMTIVALRHHADLKWLNNVTVLFFVRAEKPCRHRTGLNNSHLWSIQNLSWWDNWLIGNKPWRFTWSLRILISYKYIAIFFLYFSSYSNHDSFHIDLFRRLVCGTPSHHRTWLFTVKYLCKERHWWGADGHQKSMCVCPRCGLNQIEGVVCLRTVWLYCNMWQLTIFQSIVHFIHCRLFHISYRSTNGSALHSLVERLTKLYPETGRIVVPRKELAPVHVNVSIQLLRIIAVDRDKQSVSFRTWNRCVS